LSVLNSATVADVRYAGWHHWRRNKSEFAPQPGSCCPAPSVWATDLRFL